MMLRGSGQETFAESDIISSWCTKAPISPQIADDQMVVLVAYFLDEKRPFRADCYVPITPYLLCSSAACGVLDLRNIHSSAAPYLSDRLPPGAVSEWKGVFELAVIPVHRGMQAAEISVQVHEQD